MAGPVYSGGPIINITYTTGSTSPGTDIINAFIANMPSAGWTHSAIPATDTATFGGNPANNDTIALDTTGAGNKTYTFKSSLTGAANEVLIDTSAAATIQNLMNAIIAGPGAGTKYGTGTTANTTVGVQSTTASTITVKYLTNGSAGNAAVVTKSSSAITWASGTLSGGSDLWTSKITPQGLACTFGLFTESGSFYNPGAKLDMIGGDRTLTRSFTHQLENATPPSTIQYRLIASPYQFVHFAVGATQNQTAGYWIAGGVPFIPALQQALVVTGATNASPIQITTASAHGFTSGDQVLVVGATGNTAANGTWMITVVDSFNFTLTGSTGNGSYISSPSAYVADITSMTLTAEAIWFQFTSSGSGNNFRNAMVVNSLDWSSLNTFTRAFNSSSDVGQFLKNSVIGPSPPSSVQWSNNNFLIYEPTILWGVSPASTPKIIGQLWDSFLLAEFVSLEQTFSADTPSHNFMIVGGDSSQNTSFAVAIT